LKRWIFGSISVMVGLFILTGCFNFDDGIRIPLGDGESVTIGGGEEGDLFNINIESEDGSVNLSSDGESFSYEGEDGKVTVYT
ncbi:hypothetical protein, partial [Pseudomonas sp. 2995-1]|uniref:hypothetical protein n=1 Tax=Pseudomonas sp. 2995-1 TaxID=1712679 RepID=UPI0013042558